MPLSNPFFVMRTLFLFLPLLLTAIANGDDRSCDEKDLADSVRTDTLGMTADRGGDHTFFAAEETSERWLQDMSARLKRILPARSILHDARTRDNFLRTVRYEAARAGLDIQKMLAIIHVESAFRKYAISSAGARGYMQIMPFWVNVIGEKEKHSLFALRTNLRYGAVIFRCYLDIEKGDYYRALGRYNGSLGKARYPRAVFEKEEEYWRWP